MPFLFIFLLLTLVAAIITYRRVYLSQITRLKSELEAANTLLRQHIEKLNATNQTNEFEKYAGLIVEQLDRAVVIIDEHGTVRFINSRAKQLLGAAATVGKPYKEIFYLRPPGGSSDTVSLIEPTFTSEKLQELDNVELVGQHGTFPIRGTVIPLPTSERVKTVIVSFEDNTAHMSRLKEEQSFFSAAAHELRTPLTVIRMTISLLLEKFDSLPREKTAEHLRRADETAEQLVRLVNELLNISRIDQGRLEIKTEKFDIVKLTDSVISNLSLLAKERNLYIHHPVEGTERFVTADLAKTEEILTNLISNGLKYTIRGGLTIEHKATGSTLTTRVTDTGYGIPHEMQRLLFKRFGQVGTTQSQTPAKSIGLGLYIAKKFAQYMHGDVSLERSEPSVGSTFVFTLPSG